MPKLCQYSQGNVSISSWRPFEKYLKGMGDGRLFGKCPKSIGNLFSNLYRVEDTLWEMPKQKSRPAGCISHRVSSHQEARISPQPIAHHVSAYIRHVLLISTKHSSLLNLITNGDMIEKFNNYQRFFSYFFSFQPYHFCPNSNWCKVPVKGLLHIRIFSDLFGMVGQARARHARTTGDVYIFERILQFYFDDYNQQQLVGKHLLAASSSIGDFLQIFLWHLEIFRPIRRLLPYYQTISFCQICSCKVFSDVQIIWTNQKASVCRISPACHVCTGYSELIQINTSCFLIELMLFKYTQSRINENLQKTPTNNIILRDFFISFAKQNTIG